MLEMLIVCFPFCLRNGMANEECKDEPCPESCRPLQTRRESVNPQFVAIDNPTVYTRRGLIRGQRTLEAKQLIHSLAELNNLVDSDEVKQITAETETVPATTTITSPMLGRRKPAGFGQGGFSDRSSSLWDWPLGPVSVYNTENEFEVKLAIAPFTSAEVAAKVMGNELLIHCKSNAPLPTNQYRSRELFRSYQMPLNVDPKTVQFKFKNEKYLHVIAKKEKPIKLALAFDPVEVAHGN
ncbi:Heat shock protein Hsp-12.2 [Trichinella pseudospiralis]|uniref:Heat shock protein Hsp-12.2 n=1 Tax=Trichinella pseudospiralis TaxID=6337 RepID=A0A0V1FMD9_TRIPS|nr:Heat shock protein Hsp-12.2 [Trichinella pseudospiralis]